MIGFASTFTALTLASSALALPTFAKRKAAELAPAAIDWIPVGSNFYNPLSGSSSPTLVKRDSSDDDSSEMAQSIANYGIYNGKVWRVNGAVRDVAISLLSGFYETGGTVIPTFPASISTTPYITPTATITIGYSTDSLSPAPTSSDAQPTSAPEPTSTPDDSDSTTSPPVESYSSTAADSSSTSEPSSEEDKTETTSRVPLVTAVGSLQTTSYARTTTTRRSTTTTRKSTTTTRKTSSTTTRRTSTTTRPTSTTTVAPTTTSAPVPTPSASSIPGQSWYLATVFKSIATFASDVAITSYLWGKDNFSVVQGVPAGDWSSTPPSSNSQESAIKVVYPAGSYSPSNYPIGGLGFYSNPLDISGANNVSMTYSVFFPKDFDFVKGGKLPGLYGGTRACSGGSAAENCFSTRMMWRAGGQGELYLYAPREKQVDALCTLPPLSFCNSYYGMSIGRGSWTFKPGQWTHMRQDVWLNTPGKADGGFNIWVNGKLALTSSSVYYRNSVAGNNANGTAPNPITLINYDDLPDGTVIPNGGFATYPNLTSTIVPTDDSGSEFSPTMVTKIIGTGTATSLVTETTVSLPVDWQNKRQRRSVGLAEPTPTLASSRTRLPDSVPTPALAPVAPLVPYETLDEEDDAEASLSKRASSLIAIGFGGMKWDTFFGGSSVAWAPKTEMHTYFNQFGLQIRS